MFSLLGENQRWQSLHFPKAWESWNMGGLSAPHEPQPCLLLLLFTKKAFRFGFKALWGTQSKKQGVPATARLTATFICSVSPNTFQLTFQTNISPRCLHSGCGRGEGRYFPSSFRMRQSRPRVSFLNIFITGDPLILLQPCNSLFCRPLLNALNLLGRNSSVSMNQSHQFLLNTEELGLSLSSLPRTAAFALGDLLTGKGPIFTRVFEILKRVDPQGAQGSPTGKYFPREVEWPVKGFVAKGRARTRSRGLTLRPGLQPTRPLGRQVGALRHTGPGGHVCRMAAQPNADAPSNDARGSDG